MIGLALLAGAAAVAGEPSQGMLTLFGPTGATVIMDEVTIGSLPMSVWVYDGSYSFRVELDDGRAYAVDHEVVFTADVSNITLPLMPDSPGVTEAPAEAPPIPPLPTPTQVMVNAYGATGALVYVNGERIGQIPLSVRLEAGTYTFQVLQPDGTSFEVTHLVAPQPDAGAISLDMTR